LTRPPTHLNIPIAIYSYVRLRMARITLPDRPHLIHRVAEANETKFRAFAESNGNAFLHLIVILNDRRECRIWQMVSVIHQCKGANLLTNILIFYLPPILPNP